MSLGESMLNVAVEGSESVEASSYHGESASLSAAVDKGLKIWKLSHGCGSFSGAEHQEYLDRRLAVMHEDTGKGQADQFKAAPVGSLFFLCHGNSLQRICQFTSGVSRCDKDDGGWLQRDYVVIKEALLSGRYTNNSKYWSPQGNSTFWAVPDADLDLLEKTLLGPYFGATLKELSAVPGQPTAVPNLDEASGLDFSESEGERSLGNRIYYGPPGTGKTRAAQLLLNEYYTDEDTKEKNYTFVTFHQSYGYEEFVEGLRPVLAPESKREVESGVQGESDVADAADHVFYEIRSGAFKKLCKKARLAPGRRFAVVVDEINRGNISKIFGELITLIETDKREDAEHAVTVTLPYSGESFSVPSNVDIIGTMNTADRSLALLDTALRRRFEFVPYMPDTSEADDAPLKDLKVNIDGHKIDVRLLLERINQRIEALYDRDHTIGHAYFTPLKKVEDEEKRFSLLSEIFKGKILPLLEEYFFEDWQKIRLVLGDNQKEKRDRATCFVTVKEESDGDLDSLFGSDHGLDAYATKPRYELQAEAFDDPRAYIGIYDLKVV